MRRAWRTRWIGPTEGYVAWATANREGRRDARGDPTAVANMARVPIKIPPENSLRAIFFPGLPACSAFPTTHTLHPSHQYARWEGYGVEDPALSIPYFRLRRPSHPRFSIRLSHLISTFASISLSLLSSLSFYQALFRSLPFFLPFSLFAMSLFLRARERSRARCSRLRFYYLVADSFFNSFPPFFGDLIVMYTHACDPPACRTYIPVPRAAVAHRLRREMHSARR